MRITTSLARAASTRLRERGILFSAAMVRAILAGRKTQTRRILSKRCSTLFRAAAEIGEIVDFLDDSTALATDLPYLLGFCPYGEPGTILLVKESAWMWCERRPNGTTKTGRQKWHYVPLRSAPVLYKADHEARSTGSVTHPDTGNQWGWRLKIGRYLPKWAVRIRCELTGVKLERLQAITEEDATAEGIEPEVVGHWSGWRNYHAAAKNALGANIVGWARPADSFRSLWESINGEASWQANPWVWAMTLKRLAS